MNFQIKISKKNRELLKNYSANPSIENRNKIVELNSGLVKKSASRYANSPNTEFEDLMQIGYLGLIRAIERFNPEKQYLEICIPFYGFAKLHIEGSIKHYLRDKSNPIKIPRSVYELNFKIKRFKTEYFADRGTLPSNSEIAAKLDIDLEKLFIVRNTLSCLTIDTLDRKLQSNLDNQNIMLKDIIPSRTKCIADNPEIFNLTHLVSQLDYYDARLIIMYFFEGKTYREIAKILRKSESTICKHSVRAVNKLKLELI